MDKPYLIGIGGGTSSGKSTLVQILQERLGANQVAVMHTDTFFLPGTPTHNRPEALNEPALHNAVAALRRGEPAELPARGDRPAQMLEPKPVVLIEGHLCLTFSWLVEQMDLTIYVDMDDEERAIRRIVRNVAGAGQDLLFVTDWYCKDVIGNHHRFVEPTKRVADLILWGDWQERRMAQVVKLIRCLAGLAEPENCQE